MIPRSWVSWVLVGAVFLTLAGCSASMMSSPDNPTSAGGLTPNVKDKDIGLVAVAPNFNMSKYRVIVVDRFPVTDPETKDEGDRNFAAKMAPKLHQDLVRRLQESGLFQRVVSGGDTQFKPGAEPALRLQGAITRLGRGSQAARLFGGFGAGRARAQADMRFVDVSSGRVVLVAADRRIADGGWFGGDDENLIDDCFDDMAKDLAKFLVRLSKGDAPRQ